MWIPKWQRDQQFGIDSPVPTQAVSNEEFIPRPQTTQQRQWESLIQELAEEKSRKLGMQRRDFLRTSMGMATAFLASNMVYGPNWDVDAGGNARTGRDRREVSQGRVLHHGRTDPLHRRRGHRISQGRVRPQHGLRSERQSRCLQLRQLRQGDLLRQRNQHGRDLRSSGPRDQQEPRGQGAGRTRPAAAASCPVG